MKLTEIEIKNFLNAVLKNRSVNDELKENIYEMLENYKTENICINSFLNILNDFIIENNLNETETELSKSLIYKGTLLRIHKDGEKPELRRWAAWTTDVMYLSEINISDYGLILTTSTEIDNGYGINIDDFCVYLYNHGYLPNKISNYEKEVLYPITNEILVSEIVYNGLDD